MANASWVQSMVGPTTHFIHNHSPEQCAATTASGKVAICHVPPGNPANAHSILVDASAVPAHLAHGDYFGACGAHGSTPSASTLQINTQPQPYEFDVSALGALILPGRAFPLCFTLPCPRTLLIRVS